MMLSRRRCCCSAPTFTCEGCTITQAPLTVSWVNPTLGDGSVPITYIAFGAGGWSGAVVGQIDFFLNCVNVGGPKWNLRARTPGPVDCERFLVVGTELALTAYTCSPFVLEFTVNNAGSPRCVSHYALGYRKYTVTL